MCFFSTKALFICKYVKKELPLQPKVAKTTLCPAPGR